MKDSDEIQTKSTIYDKIIVKRYRSVCKFLFFFLCRLPCTFLHFFFSSPTRTIGHRPLHDSSKQFLTAERIVKAYKRNTTNQTLENLGNSTGAWHDEAENQWHLEPSRPNVAKNNRRLRKTWTEIDHEPDLIRISSSLQTTPLIHDTRIWPEILDSRASSMFTFGPVRIP